MPHNATTWTEKSNPSWHARFGLVGAAAIHDLHVIQGPNVTRDAREKIAFFAFHAFVVEDSRFRQNRVRTKLYNCGACVCKSNVEIRIACSFCRPQLKLATHRFFLFLSIMERIRKEVICRKKKWGLPRIQQKYSYTKLTQRSSGLYFVEFRLGARAWNRWRGTHVPNELSAH